MDTSDLAKRMKEYEAVSKTRLETKKPVIIRLDGKAFHTFTRGFKKPFDPILHEAMTETMKYLCENIQGCVLGYTQSDEITLVLVDYKNPRSQSWFDYEVQKMCSIAASMAAMFFNREFSGAVGDEHYICESLFIPKSLQEHLEMKNYLLALKESCKKGAMFDARVFSLEKDEVTNCLYWRQLDAMRNSVQLVGQANFSHKELQGKSCNDIKKMLAKNGRKKWEDYPLENQRGCCCIKETYTLNLDENNVKPCEEPNVIRHRWVIDREIPVFKGKGREYVDKLIYIQEEE